MDPLDEPHDEMGWPDSWRAQEFPTNWILIHETYLIQPGQVFDDDARMDRGFEMSRSLRGEVPLHWRHYILT